MKVKKRLQQQNRTRKMDQLSSMKQQFGGHTVNKKWGKSLHWLKNGNLKRETEGLLSAAREQSWNTNSVRKIYHKDVSNKCGLCERHVENVLHIVSACTMLAQKGMFEHPLGLMQELWSKSMWKVVQA